MKRFLVTVFLPFLLHTSLIGGERAIAWAKIQGPKTAVVKFEGDSPVNRSADLTLSPPLAIARISLEDDVMHVYTRQPFRLDTHYYLKIQGAAAQFLQPDGILDSLYSEKPLGYRREKGGMSFRVFAPRARWVRLVLYDHYQDSAEEEFLMARDEQGVWEYVTGEDWSGKYYGYRLWGPEADFEMFDSTIVLADPYSPAVATRNYYTHPGKTLILAREVFDWQGDTRLSIDPRDLIIYEMHIRDMTAHPSSGTPASLRGSYQGLIHNDQRGGLPYIRSLGVNAVELLPAQDFGNMEVPYRDSSAAIYNTWNPYARNHWGYMTSYFFAPESYYASGATMEPGHYNGADGRQVREFKEMVRAFHRQGIAVIMDVVYNHVSQYDYNPLKYIDKLYYFRLTPDCQFESHSGCGNDLKTERPMARRLIIDSVKHWMQTYHVDGFRFDLATLLDRETCEMITTELRGIDPQVILIAEPWHAGGYAPDTFSDIGWAAWNDQIRNGFKGGNPHNDRGFIFGDWQDRNSRQTLQRYVMGSLRELGGPFREVRHSLNYLASHDDHTLGDFIRLALNDVDEKNRILDRDAQVRLTSQQLMIQKLAALALFTSQGPLMIHEGQEFARSKVIIKTTAADSNWGRIDHNSYAKDNETNWLDFDHAKINAELFAYYQKLIQLRKTYRAFRRAVPEQFHFFETGDSLLLAYELSYPQQHFMVALNGNPVSGHQLPLPAGKWKLIADQDAVYPEDAAPYRTSHIEIPARSGIILKRIN